MQPPLRSVVCPFIQSFASLPLLTSLRSVPKQGQAPIHVRQSPILPHMSDKPDAPGQPPLKLSATSTGKFFTAITYATTHPLGPLFNSIPITLSA